MARIWLGRILLVVGALFLGYVIWGYLPDATAWAGMALIVGDLGSVIGFFFGLTFFLLKASREEQILEAEFGVVYASYRERTGSLLPRIAHV